MSLKSKSFTMAKGSNPLHFRIACAAARMLTETGEALLTSTITGVLADWDVRPIEFAETYAGKPVPAEYAGFMGGNLAPTHCPDPYWREVAVKALTFRDVKQFLRSSLRLAAVDGTLPRTTTHMVCALVESLGCDLYGELVEE